MSDTRELVQISPEYRTEDLWLIHYRLRLPKLNWKFWEPREYEPWIDYIAIGNEEGWTYYGGISGGKSLPESACAWANDELRKWKVFKSASREFPTDIGDGLYRDLLGRYYWTDETGDLSYPVASRAEAERLRAGYWEFLSNGGVI